MEPDEAVLFRIGHIIYGLTLGTWMSSRERSGGSTNEAPGVPDRLPVPSDGGVDGLRHRCTVTAYLYQRAARC